MQTPPVRATPAVGLWLAVPQSDIPAQSSPAPTHPNFLSLVKAAALLHWKAAEQCRDPHLHHRHLPKNFWTGSQKQDVTSCMMESCLRCSQQARTNRWLVYQSQAECISRSAKPELFYPKYCDHPAIGL